MDFGGVVGMDGLACASECGGSLFSSSVTPSSTELSWQRGFLESSFQKHGRSAEPEECHDWRSLKVARTDQAIASAPTKTSPFLQGSSSHSIFSDGERMLSFSSTSKEDALMLATDGVVPYYQYQPLASSSIHPYLRNAGLYSGCSDSGNMHGVMARVRGPFTPSQWLELEHQALIYKYIVAKVPIPASLLIHIRRSLTPYSTGSLGSSALGWGSFHLGYSGNADPEPGRCRRTDGKKWRCSRDAVADQKYCERHINRGRHRSRKHVEGQNGHAVKAAPASAPSQSASAVSGGGLSSSLSTAQQQAKSFQPSVTDSSSAQLNRMILSKVNRDDRARDSESLSMLTSVNPKSTSTLFPISIGHNPFEPTSSKDCFGLVSADSLLNPASSSSDNISFLPNLKLNDTEPRSNLFRQFIDDSKSKPDRSTINWHESEEMLSDRTQLSMSISVASSDFSSSSPNHEKLTLSSLDLSRENDPVHMSLGVGMLNEGSRRQASWIPILWESSMAGPLGEVLTNTSNTPKDRSKNCSSSLNLLIDGWDSSPRLESSPTGVLQKTSLDSLSSSTRSSPRTENHRAHESTGSLCDDILGTALVNDPAISSL